MKKNILVVEDTKSIREEICDILRMEGFNVSEAENGKYGFIVAKRTKPQLIISDILMPEVDGFELFEILSENSKTKKIPVIFLSAKADKEAVEKAKTIGCGEYLIKPISPDDLLKIVNNRIKKTEILYF